MNAIYSPGNNNCEMALDPAIVNQLETGRKALQVIEGTPFNVGFRSQVWWSASGIYSGQSLTDVPGVFILVSAEDSGIALESPVVTTAQSEPNGPATANASFTLTGATLPSSLALVRLVAGPEHIDMPVVVTAPTLATDAGILAALGRMPWVAYELNISLWAVEGPETQPTPGNPFSGGRLTLGTGPTEVAAARAAFIAAGVNPLTV